MKVYFQTHGCSTNQAEEEVMAGLLNKAGYKKVQKKEDADLIILNMCSVKGIRVAKKQIEEINESKKEHQKLIVAGCIPRNEYKKLRDLAQEASFCHTDNIMQIVEVAEETMNNNPIDLMTVQKGIKIGMPRIRRNNLIAIIPINEGCNDSCTYCSTKLIKGNTLSYPMQAIVKETEDALNEGCKEVWLTSQDTGAYGWDLTKKSMLPDLIKTILKIKREFKLRIGMPNPMNIYNQFDEVLKVMDDPKVYKFLHLPLQSGNNEVLNAMKRKYTVEQFTDICSRFQQKFPEATIATDIIVGFPGETESQFEDTMEIVRKIKFDVINISRYEDRPGTASSRMKNKIHGQVSKKRSELLTDLFEKIATMNKEKWLGWQGEVLINDKKDDLVARNFAYKVIVIKKPETMTEEEYNGLLGKEIKVKIVKTDMHFLIGEIKN